MPSPTSAPLLAARPRSPSEDPAAELERIATRWLLQVRAGLAPLNLTHAQFRLLVATGWLNSRSNGVRQADIAGHANTDPVTTSEVLRTLEARGLVTRSPHPTDKRAKAITVTDAGGALADRAIRLVDSLEARFFTDGMPEFATLSKVLKRGGRGRDERRS
jgi:DNA-binding MarR family transcriptional regulator